LVGSAAAGFGTSVGFAGAWVGAGVGAGAEQAASNTAAPDVIRPTNLRRLSIPLVPS
jgi:hypothetical protein